MGYDVNNDPYIDPETGILANKLGITHQSELDFAEAEITTIIIATLTTESDIDHLVFDRELLQEMHKEIFSDIYEWAGEFRSLDISKGESYFAHAAHISTQLDELFSELASDDALKSSDKDNVVERLAHYYSELNVVHPFREGNGRVIRTYVRLLALKFGWDIEWGGLDRGKNIDASKAAMFVDENPMRMLLAPLIKKV